MKKIGLVLSIILAIALIAGIGFLIYNQVQMRTQGNTYPEVTFELENYGKVKIELYPQYAPNTVANIIKLVESGYYNDKVFYGRDKVCIYVGRDQNGEVVNPKSNLVLGGEEENAYEYEIDGEFIANGFEANTLRHEKGVVSIIRKDYSAMLPALAEQSYNSGNSQIGIMMGENASNLNGVYTAFGKVIEGMDIIEKLYNEAEILIKPEETADEPDETNSSKKTEAKEEKELTEEDDADGILEFSTYPKIVSTTVDTKGITFPEPLIHEAFDYQSYISDYLGTNQNIQVN